MPFNNYTDAAILNWTAGTEATDSKYIVTSADWSDSVATGAGTSPIMGSWLNEEKVRVIKWNQKFTFNEMASDATTFSAATFNEKKFKKIKTGFLDDLQRRITVGFEEEIISGVGWGVNTTIGASTTFNVEVQPPPRRHGGIYHMKGRKRRGLWKDAQPNEEKARRLLQRIIGFQRYARYIRDGFVNYQGKSGRVYQIFPGTTHMPVWFKGKMVEKLCLCIQDYKVPPTDSVVMRLLMLEHSEAEFRAQANIHKAGKMDQQIIDESIEAIHAMADRARGLALAG